MVRQHEHAGRPKLPPHVGAPIDLDALGRYAKQPLAHGGDEVGAAAHGSQVIRGRLALDERLKIADERRHDATFGAARTPKCIYGSPVGRV